MGSYYGLDNCFPSLQLLKEAWGTFVCKDLKGCVFIPSLLSGTFTLNLLGGALALRAAF